MKKMENHAFIITAHHQPNLLKRTLKILEADNHYFYIHINQRSGDLSPFLDATKDIKNVTFVARIKLYHGDISQIHATLIMLKAALDSGVDFTYFHQITGQDYPLRSNEQFDSFFHEKSESFMFFDDLENCTAKALKRIQRRVTQYRPKTIEGKWRNRLFYLLGFPQILSLFLKLPPLQDIASGSDFFSLHKSVVYYIMNYNQQHPDYLCRFVGMSSPSEIYYHTMLKPVANELNIHTQMPLRYNSFVAHRKVDTKYRPYDLNEEDFEYVMKTPCFFCRKVHEVTSKKLLDMIDKQRGREFDITKYKNIF